MLMKNPLKSIRFRANFVQTQAQKELFAQLQQVCATERGLWQKFEEETAIDALHLIAQNVDQGYGLSQQEEARLGLALKEHIKKHNNRLEELLPDEGKRSGRQAAPLTLPVADPVKPSAADYQPRITAFGEASKVGDDETAGEHECLREIVHAVRDLPRQAQGPRWTLLVMISGLGMKESAWNKYNVPYMNSNTAKVMGVTKVNLLSERNQADSERESLGVLLDNMLRHLPHDRIDIWRNLRQTACKGP